MRLILSLILLLLVKLCESQTIVELNLLQHSGKLNLVPMYGSPYIQKWQNYIDADNDFIKLNNSDSSVQKGASKEFIDLGLQYFYNGQLQTAMKRFNQAWLLDSTNAGCYFGFWLVQSTLLTTSLRKEYFGKIGVSIDDVFSPIRYYEMGQKLDSDAYFEKRALAYGCSSFDAYEQSNLGIESCLNRLKFEATDTIALHNLAHIYSDVEDWDNALNIQNKNLEFREDKGLVYNDIGWTHEQRGKIDSALTYYMKAITCTEASYFKPRINYCLLKEKSGDCANTISVIDECISILPDEGYFHFIKAKLQLCLGRKEEALVSLKHSKKLGCDEAKQLLKELK